MLFWATFPVADVIGFSATKKDVELFEAIGKAPDAAKYPNVARFYSHIASFSADQKAKLPAAFGAAGAAAPASAPAKAAAPAPAAAEEEDIDLFGDDSDAAAAKVSAAAPKVRLRVEKGFDTINSLATRVTCGISVLHLHPVLVTIIQLSRRSRRSPRRRRRFLRSARPAACTRSSPWRPART